MKNKYLAFSIFILITPVFQQESTNSYSSYDRIIKSIVKIQVDESGELDVDANGIVQSDYSLGSGFYISENGLFLTAAHVIAKRTNNISNPISCFDLDRGETFGPDIIFEDKNSDIALLQNPMYTGREKNNYYIDIFSKASNIKEGMSCYSIGFPNEVHGYNKIMSISFGKILGIDKNLRGYNKLPYRKKVVISSCEVVSGFSGGIMIDSAFLPIGMILGSIEQKGEKQSFVRRISDIRRVVKKSYDRK